MKLKKFRKNILVVKTQFDLKDFYLNFFKFIIFLKIFLFSQIGCRMITNWLDKKFNRKNIDIGLEKQPWIFKNQLKMPRELNNLL